LLGIGNPFDGGVTVVSSLTLMVWLTQALRRFELLTSQGQTLLVFGSIIALTLPTFLLVTTPAALFIAVLYTLNRLNSDSELVVMSAAGVGPWRIFGPLFLLASLVAISSAAIAIHYGPPSMRSLRPTGPVNADIVTNVAIPAFTTVQRGSRCMCATGRRRDAMGYSSTTRVKGLRRLSLPSGRIDAPMDCSLCLNRLATPQWHRYGRQRYGTPSRQLDRPI
jgi:hypothetical protein